MTMQRGKLLGDGAVILLATAFLILPLWHIEYLRNWGSIDSTFIADARFLKDHGPHPSWQPLWYCGTRFDYIYPPALRYGTALVSMVFGVSTARAYHLYTALLYSLGSVGVYLLVLAAGGTRVWGWIAAAATATLSPSFPFLRSFREDSLLRMPQRLNVLIQWGEGPHVSALAFVPFALACAWVAIRGGGRRWIAPAAVLAALVVSHNFYGALAFGILFAVLAWSLWITHLERRIWTRAALIAVLAYVCSAFWLTPSYVRVTIENLRLVAHPGNSWSRWLAAGVIVLFAAVSARLARGRKHLAWRVFVCGAALIFSLDVIGSYYFGFRVAGEPHRFVPELDLVLILLCVEALSRRRAVAALAVVAAFAAGYLYLSRPWSVFEADPNYRARVEYKLSEWLARTMPGARAFVTGSLRLWYNAWFDGEQVGGGSEQGLINGTLSLAQWQITRDVSAGRDIQWLQAVGADVVVVHQRGSQEIFQEFTSPAKFAGRLPVLYDDAQGDVIYRVPRRFPAHARVVEKARMEALRPIPVSDDDREELAAYVGAVENGPDREVSMAWDGVESIRLRADVRQGELLLVQESYDPAWRAYAGRTRLRVRKDACGFMLVETPVGTVDVVLVAAARNFATGREHR
jgi:hypothetical protein